MPAEQPQESMRQIAALMEGFELDPAGRAGPEDRPLAGLGLDEARRFTPVLASVCVRDEVAACCCARRCRAVWSRRWRS